MLYVQFVESTLKNGCDVELGERNVIVGPNGGGKSTIVQAIELASNGWVSDMEGRARVKLHTALARLFQDDTRRFSKIIMSDGSVCEWTLEDGTKEGSFKKPDHTADITLRWPVQDLMETLRGDVTTVATWLEQQVMGDLKESQVLSALPPAVRDLAKEFVKKTRKADFMALAKDAKNEAKTLRTQATRTEKTIESMVEGIAPPLDDEQRVALEEQVKQMNAPVSGVSQEEYNRMSAEIDSLAQDLVQVQEVLTDIPSLSPAIAQAVQKIITVQQLIRTHAEALGLDECWVCGNQKPDFQAHANRVAVAKTQLAGHIQTEEKRRALAGELVNLEERLIVRANQFKQVKVAPVVDDTERRALMGQIAADDAARRTWNNADAQRKEVDQLRSRAELLNVAGSAFEKAGKSYLDKCKSDFETTVSQFLPSGERLGVDLESGRLGLVRNKELHSALSGAEWSRVLMALAAAQEKGKMPAVIVPEDRAWDSVTLTNVMTAMRVCPVQIIIMSTVRPNDVEGWKIIEVGNG